ncbi:hypothetical protein [Ruegeria lacuscaerulensis]|uniref:hypothetical protein n=1 Tax=Ruegeria lacuscaerulensis TaxID=55218 RepID=UPI00147BCCCB|nr:hypothetical protein [Ruegeria lacuscaerulensis]
MTNPNGQNVEVAKINARALIITAVISAGSGFGVAALALLNDDGQKTGLIAAEWEDGDLPPSVCTTVDGEIGKIVVTTAIFNKPTGSFHAFEQQHIKPAGKYGYSTNSIADLIPKTGDYRVRHWGAKWECVK